MAGTTPNNSWPYPESSDFVADGATAIENLADAIDASLPESNLKVDTVNNRVGINDITPSYSLDVTGDINATGDIRIGGAPIVAGLLDTSIANDVTVTTSTTDVTSVTFTLPSTRYVMIAINISQIDTVTADTGCYFLVQDTNAAGSPSSTYHRSVAMCLNGLATSACSFGIRTLSAGTYTMYLVANTTTGSVKLNEIGSQNARNCLAVVDMGS